MERLGFVKTFFFGGGRDEAKHSWPPLLQVKRRAASPGPMAWQQMGLAL